MTRLTNTQPSGDEPNQEPETGAAWARRTGLPLFNRELSQIEFYRRVLEKALDAGAPLLPLVAEHARCLREDILPALAAKDVTVAAYNTLSLPERQQLREFYKKQ